MGLRKQFVPKQGDNHDISNKTYICLSILVLLFIVNLTLNIWFNMTRSGTSFSFGGILNQSLTVPRKLIHETWRGLHNQTASVTKDVHTGNRQTTGSPGFMSNKPTSWKDNRIPSKKKCTPDFRNHHFMAANYIGRTGNKFFTHATLIATAEQTCYTAIHKSGFIPKLDNIFDIKNLKKGTYNTSTFKLLREPGWGIYDVSITSRIDPKYNWTLAGFRQSYRYFSGYEDLIRSSFIFKADIKKDVMKYLTTVTNGNPLVCIHVRRGDRVNSVGARASELSYFNRALEYMKRYLAPLDFSLIVTSDEIPWCKRNIKWKNIYYSPFKDAGRDLCLLTQCDHSIITTGTFGWVGAWLNNTGLVIYDRFFPLPKSTLEKKYRHADYYPLDWIGL